MDDCKEPTTQTLRMSGMPHTVNNVQSNILIALMTARQPYICI